MFRFTWIFHPLNWLTAIYTKCTGGLWRNKTEWRQRRHNNSTIIFKRYTSGPSPSLRHFARILMGLSVLAVQYCHFIKLTFIFRPQLTFFDAFCLFEILCISVGSWDCGLCGNEKELNICESHTANFFINLANTVCGLQFTRNGLYTEPISLVSSNKIQWVSAFSSQLNYCLSVTSTFLFVLLLTPHSQRRIKGYKRFIRYSIQFKLCIVSRRAHFVWSDGSAADDSATYRLSTITSFCISVWWGEYAFTGALIITN